MCASAGVPAHLISVLPVRSGRSKENSFIKSALTKSSLPYITFSACNKLVLDLWLKT